MITIHRSKGLEFPVVYCPFVWDGWIMPIESVALPRSRQPAYKHTVDVGARGTRTVPPPLRSDAGRAARGGPPSALRRADPRQPSGGALVGGTRDTATRRCHGSCSSGGQTATSGRLALDGPIRRCRGERPSRAGAGDRSGSPVERSDAGPPTGGSARSTRSSELASTRLRPATSTGLAGAPRTASITSGAHASGSCRASPSGSGADAGRGDAAAPDGGALAGHARGDD